MREKPDYGAANQAWHDKWLEWARSDIDWNVARADALRITQAMVDAAIGDFRLVSSAALIIERDENGEWPSDIVERVVGAYVDLNNKGGEELEEYAKAALDALASPLSA